MSRRYIVVVSTEGYSSKPLYEDDDCPISLEIIEAFEKNNNCKVAYIVRHARKEPQRDNSAH